MLNQLLSVTLFFSLLTPILFADSPPSAEVKKVQEVYIEQDGNSVDVWTGPGYYNGVWFDDEQTYRGRGVNRGEAVEYDRGEEDTQDSHMGHGGGGGHAGGHGR